MVISSEVIGKGNITRLFRISVVRKLRVELSPNQGTFCCQRDRDSQIARDGLR